MYLFSIYRIRLFFKNYFLLKIITDDDESLQKYNIYHRFMYLLLSDMVNLEFSWLTVIFKVHWLSCSETQYLAIDRFFKTSLHE